MAGARSDVVKAQIPGRVVRLWVEEGDTVEAGQRLLAIEAMKMENEVRAPRAGTVESDRGWPRAAASSSATSCSLRAAQVPGSVALRREVLPSS